MSTTVVAPPPEGWLLTLLESDPPLLARIVLAMLGGATWTTLNGIPFLFQSAAAAERANEPIEVGKLYRASDIPRSDHWVVYLHPEEPSINLDVLPNPFTDPAAAWDLEDGEMFGWECTGLNFHRYRWDDAVSVMARYGPWHSIRRHALVLAVLHKHANGPYSPLIRPLLERMEAQHG